MLNTGSSVWNAARYSGHRNFRLGGPNMPRVGEVYRIEPAKPKAYWSQYMKGAGYETYFTGKWHVGIPAVKAFDHAAHVRGGMPDQHPTRYQRIFVEGKADTWSPYNEYAGSGRTLRDEQLAPFPRTEYSVKKNMQEYYALVTHMDAQIGKILDALEASGKADNTYIFFTAHHGLAAGEHGFLGKQNMYESSVQVPLMMSGPGLEAGKQVGAQVYLQDVRTSWRHRLN
jgi:arylsulfatase A-like enzyme